MADQCGEIDTCVILIDPAIRFLILVYSRLQAWDTTVGVFILARWKASLLSSPKSTRMACLLVLASPCQHEPAHARSTKSRNMLTARAVILRRKHPGTSSVMMAVVLMVTNVMNVALKRRIDTAKPQRQHHHLRLHHHHHHHIVIIITITKSSMPSCLRSEQEPLSVSVGRCTDVPGRSACHRA